MASNHGKVLMEAQALTITTESDKQELQTKDVNFIAFLKLENDASGNYAYKIQHSPNGSDWFDLVSFVATGGNTTECIKLDNTTDHVFEHVKAVATKTAGTTSATIILHHDRV